jgi:hypothetical protein
MRSAIGHISCLGSVVWALWTTGRWLVLHLAAGDTDRAVLPSAAREWSPLGIHKLHRRRLRWACVADWVLGNLEGKIGRWLGVTGPAQSADPPPLVVRA